ncbi:MAG: hypothetical protein PUF13_11110 [Lachnospiraceae bacterium]|nr:hypothetical protein [Lachnospiraceae bacterium]
MDPIPARGSMIPMLAVLIIFPTPDTATGLTPAMAKAKANRSTIAVTGCSSHDSDRIRA